jgi:hypothetical protein
LLAFDRLPGDSVFKEAQSRRLLLVRLRFYQFGGDSIRGDACRSFIEYKKFFWLVI